MKRTIVWALICALPVLAAGKRAENSDPRLKNAHRNAAKNGWIQVHLEGLPSEVGFQHGYLLAPEIADAHRAVSFSLTHDTKKPYSYFRRGIKETFWPKVEAEYRQEIEGIAEGLKAKGVKLDVYDVAFLNAWLELVPYYADWYDEAHKIRGGPKVSAPEHCSAFVATGSFTKDGKPVMGHNAWTGYMEGQRWYVLFDIKPARGHAIFMDGYPGMIHSGDDFGYNSAGIMIAETTISQFHGFNPGGVPEFVRARKAMQYASSIDEFAHIMKEGNNGGYANNWLVADQKTGEIASLELGLKNVTLRRTRDGYYAGANFPVAEKLVREETEFDITDNSLSPNARRIRWDQLMSENKGSIDAATGQKMLADHYDVFDKKTSPSERTICGHIDLSARGSKAWQPPFAPAGAVQNKVADAGMVEKRMISASAGHACGISFDANEHMKKYPQFGYFKGYLQDMPSQPWTLFQGDR